MAANLKGVVKAPVVSVETIPSNPNWMDAFLGPFFYSVLLALLAHLFKRLTEKPRASVLIIFASSGGAAVASLSAHLILTDWTPFSDNALIGISGIFGYYGAAIVNRSMSKALESKTGVKLEESPVVRLDSEGVVEVVPPRKGVSDV